MQFSNSSFQDIHGNLNIYNGQNITIHYSETGLLELFRASSPGAAFNSLDRSPYPKCHLGTRLDLLAEVQRWIDDVNGTRVCWLSGPIGAGKSAIAQKISEICADRGQLAASFFFARASSRNTSRAFFTTLALQLALSMRDKRKNICDAVESDLTIIHQHHDAQLTQLIIKPLLLPSSPRSGDSPSPFLVVVDGVDECNSEADQLELLGHIAQLINMHELPLRFLVVSREESHIQSFFERKLGATEFSLDGNAQARDDVYIFLRHGFNEIHEDKKHANTMRSIPTPWPPDDVVQLLADRSGGYFIHASTLLRYVGEGGISDDEEYISPIDRLERVISRPSVASTEIDDLYLQVLSTCPYTKSLLRILGVLFIPLHVTGSSEIYESTAYVEALLNLRSGDVVSTLRGLHSVLHFSPGERDGVMRVRPVHTSFPDFLFDKTRAGKYYIDREEIHADMVRRVGGFIQDFETRNTKSNADALSPSLDMLCQFFLNLTEHLVNAVGSTSEKPLLDHLHQTTKMWNACISSSSLWNSQNQVALLCMLSSIIRYFKLLRPHPPEHLIIHFTGLLDLAFRSQISPSSAPLIRTALILIHEGIRVSSVDEMQKLLRISGFPVNCLEDDRYWALEDFGRLHLHGVRADLWEFLDDPKRCGDLFQERATCYTCITKNWLLFLEQPSLDQHYRFWHDAIDSRWSRFVSNCIPGDEELVRQLATFNLETASESDVERVIEWFKKDHHHTWPQHGLCRWEAYAMQKWTFRQELARPSIQCKVKIIFSHAMMSGRFIEWTFLLIVASILIHAIVHDGSNWQLS